MKKLECIGGEKDYFDKTMLKILYNQHTIFFPSRKKRDLVARDDYVSDFLEDIPIDIRSLRG